MPHSLPLVLPDLPLPSSSKVVSLLSMSRYQFHDARYLLFSTACCGALVSRTIFWCCSNACPMYFALPVLCFICIPVPACVCLQESPVWVREEAVVQAEENRTWWLPSSAIADNNLVSLRRQAQRHQSGNGKNIPCVLCSAVCLDEDKARIPNTAAPYTIPSTEVRLIL